MTSVAERRGTEREEAQRERRGGTRLERRYSTWREKSHAEKTGRMRDKTVNAIEKEHRERRKTMRQAVREMND